MRGLLALLLLLAACRSDPAPDDAGPADTTAAADAPAPVAPAVPVTVVEMQPGDRGCYLTVAEASGEAVMHLADYGVCERPDLVGLRVTLTVAPTRVQAAACAGDPACTDSEVEDLVTDVQVVPDAP
jgi:hypothetical protein